MKTILLGLGILGSLALIAGATTFLAKRFVRFFFGRWRSRRLFQETQQALPGLLWDNYRGYGNVQGQEYIICFERMYAVRHVEDDRFSINLVTTARGAYRISPYSFREWLNAKSMLKRPLRSEINGMNSEILIVIYEGPIGLAEELQRLLDSPFLTELAISLFREGYDEIMVGKERVSAGRVLESTTWIEPEVIEAHTLLLASVEKILPGADATPSQRRTSPLKVQR